MEIIQGLVTKCSKYKDNDAIINIINDNGEDAIIIRGAYSKNSKYLKYAKTFYYAKFETYKGNYSYKKLKDVSVIKDFNLLFNNYSNFAYFELIKEFFSKIYIKEDASILLKLLITTFNRIESTNKIIEYTTLFLGYSLKISGYGINVNLECARCKSKKVSFNFSIPQGAFVCNNCLECNDIILSNEEVDLLTSTFSNKYIETEKLLTLINIDYIKIILLFCRLFSYYSDNRIISTDLIKVH